MGDEVSESKIKVKNEENVETAKEKKTAKKRQKKKKYQLMKKKRLVELAEEIKLHDGKTDEGESELHDEEYHQKLEEYKKLAEQRTAKKRQKRLKKKQRQREKILSKPATNALKKEHDSASEESDEEQCTDNIKKAKYSTESHPNEADECITDTKCDENEEKSNDEMTC